MSAPSSNGQASGESKRPRACEACRGLKVRCEFDRGSRECRKCVKAGRQCQLTQPSKKRQKKSDTKVAELEKTLEDLRSELVAKGNLPKGVGVAAQDGSYNGFDASHLATVSTSARISYRSLKVETGLKPEQYSTSTVCHMKSWSSSMNQY